MAAKIAGAALKRQQTDYINRLNLGNVIVNKTDLLSDIKRNYESIFSWDIYETTEKCKMKGTDFLRKIYQKIDLVHNENRKFNFDFFCLNLISSYEMFLNFEYTQALCKVKDVIRTLRCTQIDTFFDRISDACFHIAYVTQAYIMVNLDLDVKRILTNIKPKSNFNGVEKAAIYGIKSKVFLEYSPEGNNVALDLIESARNFNDEELLWINIWLKAKRRKRTFDQCLSFPFRDELEAANKLKANNNLEFLTSAASVYAEAGYILHLKRSHINLRESTSYNQLAADLIIIVFHLAKNDIKLLYYCLSCINNLPLNIISKHITKQIVNRLCMQDNYKIQKALGKYFFKNKDLKTARDYFKKSSRSFSSSLMLIKVECLLSSVDNFPVVQYLRLLYASCTGSKKKRNISSQILLYYMYNENDNKKELLYSLDTYLNEHVDFVLKKNFTSEVYPLFQLKKKFIHSTFIDEMGNNIEKLKAYRNWNFTEKYILDRVISKFAVICNSEQIDEFIDTEMSCVVCQFHKACCVLRPCGHQCVCKNCWNSLKSNNNLCPICRTVVDYYLDCI